MAPKKETFNLNTAVSFLPVMDDTENVTKQLISSIKMYDSLLDEQSKPALIEFILTTRLSPGAKVRLSKNYKTVEHLVNDMNKFLLTKKSFTVIQQQLSQCTQKQKTIEAYGKEIEDLFVDLTIAQADGDQNKHKVLRPINEKIAINRFATGLQNTALSTIVLSRNYKSLKDVIQGANDEQASMSLSGNTAKSESKQLSNNVPQASRGRGQSSQGSSQNNQAKQQSFNQSLQGNARGGHFTTHHNQVGAKSLDNRDGNPQRGRSQCSRGGGHHSGFHHNQGAPGKNNDNRDDNYLSQRGRGHCPRGGGHHFGFHQNQGAPGKNNDNRDDNHHSQRGRGNSRGGHHSGPHHNHGIFDKNNDNRDGNNHSQRGRGHCHRGPNQTGGYHNQGNRGKNCNNRGGNNNVLHIAVPEMQIDYQFRFTANIGSTNAPTANTSINTNVPNNNKQLSKLK